MCKHCAIAGKAAGITEAQRLSLEGTQQALLRRQHVT
jgi:hypothetical protein